MIDCPTCHGDGVVEECSPLTCDGSHVHHREWTCATCDGLGLVREEPVEDLGWNVGEDGDVIDTQAQQQALIDQHVATPETFGLVVA